MGALGDVATEWNNAPAGGKALMITAVIAVAGLGLYTAHLRGASNSTQQTAGTLVPIDMTGGGSISSGGSSAPGSGTPTPTPTPTHQPPVIKPGGGSGVPPHKPIPAPPTKKPPQHPTPPPKPKKYVTVQKWVKGGYGEMSTLSAIAQKYYGNANKWTIIYNANRNVIKNPNLIYAGERLYLPGV